LAVRRLRSVIALGGLLLVNGSAQAEEKFEKVAVYLEQNLRDKDTEVKFEAIAGNTGLATLKVTAPDGRTVIDFKTPDSKLGIRHLILESPEPKDLAIVQADFLPGAYKFTGLTTDGVKLEAEAVLSHSLPEAVSLVYPRPGQKTLSVVPLDIRWRPVKNSVASIVILENEDSGHEIRTHLPGAATGFAVPDGFLQPGVEYTLAIGTVSKEGNKSFTEITFVTGRKK
jgi:hypothetical protein